MPTEAQMLVFRVLLDHRKMEGKKKKKKKKKKKGKASKYNGIPSVDESEMSFLDL